MKPNERIREACHPEKAAFKIVLWQPERKAVNRGKTEDTIPFVDNLMKDVDPESVSEIKTAITDKAAQGVAPTFSSNISLNSWQIQLH